MLNPFTHRRILKKGTPGRAAIVAMGTPARGSTSFNLAMTLQVYVEGLAPYEVEDQWMVKARDTEGLSGSIPVKVDPEDPQKVAIDWDGVRAALEQETGARQAALAAQGPVRDPAQAADPLAAVASQAASMPSESQGVTPVIDMRNDPELRRKIEQVLGRPLTPGTTEQVAANDPALQLRIMQVVQEHMAQQASAPMWGASAGGSDDALERLERLAALRNSGALTQEEFEEQKRSSSPSRVSRVTRFVVDCGVVLRLADEEIDVRPEHELLAPTLLRSQTLSTLPIEALRTA